MGFIPEKEEQDSTSEDYFLGGNGKEIKGIGDPVAGIGAALHAWSNPVNGVYPRTMKRIQHASRLINKFCQKYLPDGEVQQGRQDWMTCTSNWMNNDLECQFNYALAMGLFTNEFVEWAKHKGFINPKNGKFEIADAWSAIETNTTRVGNSLKALVEHARLHGIVPKSMLFENKSMSWNDYHNKSRITQAMRDIAKESKEWIKINYEKVPYKQFPKFTGNIRWEDFDSYVDRVDGDFIKKLAHNYNMMYYGYHLTINEIPRQTKTVEKGEIMKLYIARKNQNPERVYQLGADKKYHHIIDEPVFKGLYGDFSQVDIEDKVYIGKEEIGFTIMNEQTILQLIINLFK